NMYDNYFVHSGSPPKLYDKDHYITFFHNWDVDYIYSGKKAEKRSHNRPYRISAYLFESKPPFHIKKVTGPLIYGSPYNSSIDPSEIWLRDHGYDPASHLGTAKVVFASGTIVNDDHVLISLGVND